MLRNKPILIKVSFSCYRNNIFTSANITSRHFHQTTSALEKNIKVDSTVLAKNFQNADEFNKLSVYYSSLRKTIDSVPEEVAQKSPSLVALHHRLSLPKEFKYATLSQCLSCPSSKLPSEIKNDPKLGVSFTKTVLAPKTSDNHGLNIFGKNLLTYHITYKLLRRYPRLPTVILNAAIDAYISSESLASVGKSWGIEVENTSVVERYLKNEPVEITIGKLRYFNNSMDNAEGIRVLLNNNFSETNAYALAVRSIIAGIWASTGGENSKDVFKFIDDHILSRKLDVSKLFQFEQPTRELSMLCKRENLQRPVSKLLAESGRNSKNPVFIIGVFSGDEKLGEGFGSSLKEGKARAATDALLKWYCYESLPGYENIALDKGTIIV
ncbi:hypothetical protein TBLA_0F03950 [Henningerozyma blattae CBS 6284]|uniref:Large ribosomal subunit protein mL44 n=1 Tax=Henningerozyma blattae (strain ATCC 34711 / CBS 6284 / DSM 70876 / NBRC 10599 / NRRL Y-10934 / UCD 77-7) TaxID=1071380 RepID=I2H6C7_HENB6|nr:hypothetical protein TBLA_0F03950 [Tetrapisispora blattae CBS 6284]CCH61929.1 hypothetical protein TBLA_0F03950 [Tetrapisispora blattae CBS 6284]